MNIPPDGSLKRITSSIIEQNSIVIIPISGSLKSPFYKLESVGSEDFQENSDTESDSDSSEDEKSKEVDINVSVPSDTIEKKYCKKSSIHCKKRSESHQKDEILKPSYSHINQNQKFTSKEPFNNKHSRFNLGKRNYISNIPKNSHATYVLQNTRNHYNPPTSVENIDPWLSPKSLKKQNSNYPLITNQVPMIPCTSDMILPSVPIENPKPGLLGDSPFDPLPQNLHGQMNRVSDASYVVPHKSWNDQPINNDQGYFKQLITDKSGWHPIDFNKSSRNTSDLSLDHSNDFERPGPSNRVFHHTTNFQIPIPERKINNCSKYERNGQYLPQSQCNNFQRGGSSRINRLYKNYQEFPSDLVLDHSTDFQRGGYDGVVDLQNKSFQWSGPGRNLDPNNDYQRTDGLLNNLHSFQNLDDDGRVDALNKQFQRLHPGRNRDLNNDCQTSEGPFHSSDDFQRHIFDESLDNRFQTSLLGRSVERNNDYSIQKGLLNVPNDFQRLASDGSIGSNNRYQNPSSSKNLDQDNYQRPSPDKPKPSSLKNAYHRPEPGHSTPSSSFDYDRLGYKNFKKHGASFKKNPKMIHTKNYHNKHRWNSKAQKSRMKSNEMQTETQTEAGPGHFSFDY